MSNEITNFDDIIYSREVIERIEELEGELQDSMDEAHRERFQELKELFQGVVDEMNSVETLDYSDPPVEFDDVVSAAAADSSHYLNAEANEWDRWDDEPDLGDYIRDAAEDCRHPAYAEANEYKLLCDLRDEAQGYGDWKYCEILVRDSYFTDYAQQLAEDVGAVNENALWPNNCIDWEWAARELKMDYTAVDFDGVTYWIRS